MKQPKHHRLDNQAANLWQTYQDDAPDFWSDYEGLVAKAKRKQQELPASLDLLVTSSANPYVVWGGLLQQHFRASDQTLTCTEEKIVNEGCIGVLVNAVMMFLAFAGLLVSIILFVSTTLEGLMAIILTVGTLVLIWKGLRKLIPKKQVYYTVQFTADRIEYIEKEVYSTSKQYTLELSIPHRTIDSMVSDKKNELTLHCPTGQPWQDLYKRSYHRVVIPASIPHQTAVHSFFNTVVQYNEALNAGQKG